MSTIYQDHLRQLVTVIDGQITDLEGLLIQECDDVEIRRLVDGLAHLKLPRSRFMLVLEDFAASHFLG
jgi:hypothetical protein